MPTKQDKINDYRKQWSSKTRKQVQRELESYQRYLAKHPDIFFHQLSPEEMTDGDRILVLKELSNDQPNPLPQIPPRQRLPNPRRPARCGAYGAGDYESSVSAWVVRPL